VKGSAGLSGRGLFSRNVATTLERMAGAVKLWDTAPAFARLALNWKLG